MEMLGLLLEGPRGPTRLAQALGLSYDRFQKFADTLEKKKFVVKESEESHEVYRITAEGLQLHQDWRKVRDRFGG
jgi:predicted transcriptional regulator